MNLQPNEIVSFVIPTYNAEQYLERCINSIKNLTYPSQYIEILVADGGSSDGTLDILAKHSITPLKNIKRIAEYGKYEAFKKSRGRYIVFMDADNIIVGKDWLTKYITLLNQNPKVIGVESNYLIASDFSSINTYANLLVIVDPYARILSSKPCKIVENSNFLVKEFSKGSTPVAGANGFVWRRSILEPFAENTNTLEETTIMQMIATRQAVLIGNIPGSGIYHYYSKNLQEYIKKRQKIAGKYLYRRTQRQTWVDAHSLNYRLSRALYLLTVLGPTIEAGRQIRRTGQWEWLWHPLISCLTMLIYGYYLVKSKVTS